MAQVQSYTTGPARWTSSQEPPLREFRRQMLEPARAQHDTDRNVGRAERMTSLAAGAILGLLGLGRRDWVGFGIAGIGGALLYRGTTGRCAMYRALGVDTAQDESGDQLYPDAGNVRVTASFLINKPAEKLYTFWRNFENLPKFMSHLEAVHYIDDRRSHWVAKAPKLYGSEVEWDAEIVEDEPHSRIAWRSLPGSDVDHFGSVHFMPALGDRGTRMTVEMSYDPPGGQLGRWTAKLFGEEPKQQIHDDLRNFKRLMETGEILTIAGQPIGTCTGQGKYYGE